MPNFLDLSPELRVHIYGYIVSGRNGTPDQYWGIYISSKQMKKEIDTEAVRALEVVRQNIYPATFKFDRNMFLPSLIIINLNVPISTVIHTPQQCTSILHQFQPLLPLFEYPLEQVDICFDLPALGPRVWWNLARCFLARLEDVPGLQTPMECFTIWQTPQIDHRVLGVQVGRLHLRTDPSEGPRGMSRRGKSSASNSDDEE